MKHPSSPPGRMSDRPLASTTESMAHDSMPTRQSKLGVASFAVGLLSLVSTVWSVLLIKSLVSLLTVAAFLAPLIGVCLGTASLRRKDCRHSMAIAGLIVNAVIFLLAVFFAATTFLVMALVEGTAY